MLSDRAKIDNTKKVLRRRYLGDPITSGALVAGKYYVFANFVSGDDFSNVIPQQIYCGTTQGRTDLLFKAKDTAPTVWAHASELREWKLDELKALGEQAYESAKKTVTITGTGFEGGDARGEITFDRSILATAVEELIEETDPGYVMPVRQGGRSLGFTVEVG